MIQKDSVFQAKHSNLSCSWSLSAFFPLPSLDGIFWLLSKFFLEDMIQAAVLESFIFSLSKCVARKSADQYAVSLLSENTFYHMTWDSSSLLSCKYNKHFKMGSKTHTELYWIFLVLHRQSSIRMRKDAYSWNMASIAWETPFIFSLLLFSVGKRHY